MPVVIGAPPEDDDLAAYQIALCEALDRGDGPASDDPAMQPYRAYVDSFVPHLVELTVRLATRWHRIAEEAARAAPADER